MLERASPPSNSPSSICDHCCSCTGSLVPCQGQLDEQTLAGLDHGQRKWTWDAVRGNPRGVLLDLCDCFLSSLQSIRAHSNVVLDHGCTRSIGSRTAIEIFEKHAWYCGITTEFCSSNKSFVSSNFETETCKESSIIHFTTTPPCSTKVQCA